MLYTVSQETCAKIFLYCSALATACGHNLNVTLNTFLLKIIIITIGLIIIEMNSTTNLAIQLFG